MRQEIRTPQSRVTAGPSPAPTGRPRPTGTSGAVRLALALAAALLGLTMMGLFASPASATGSGEGTTAADSGGAATSDLPACPAEDEDIGAVDSVVRIAKVNGLIDPVMDDYLRRALDEAEADPNALGLIIWITSKGSVLDSADFRDLAARIEGSDLPIAMWVGQPGSTAQGGAAELAAVVDVVAVTPNSTIGNITDPQLDDSAWDASLADVAARMQGELLTAEESVAAGLSEGPLSEVVTFGQFATRIEGFEVFQCLTVEEGALRTIPRSQVQLSGLPLTAQLFHSVASPEVAYLFFALGLALLLFELYTAGIGVAGVLGAGFLVLGGYGMAVLPTRPWALILLLLAFVFLAVDVQTNVPRFYTGLGLVAFTVASWFLFDGFRIAWVTLIAGIGGAVLYAYSGMPSMVRTRFSTPTIGRKWMIGELGEAVTDVAPDGTIKIRDVTWRAATNRATPVKAGDTVRVVGLDRLILEVEPEEGGAKDYRERS